MNILYVTTESEDYLSDTLLHGFRQLLGRSLVDYPEKRCMYKNSKGRTPLYGRGFTIYNTLDEIDVDRTGILSRLEKGEFDYLFLSDINSQYGYYLQLLPYLSRTKVVVFDGSDTPNIFPYSGSQLRRPELFLFPRVHRHHAYFKRELTEQSMRSTYYNAIPRFVARTMRPLPNVFPVSFSIPREKVVDRIPEKKKMFPKHIVDPEIARMNDGSSEGYAFRNEEDYYLDLRQSKYGITTKRSGWDCLRHYEIAANGAVICFRDLHEKPATCAPHGLDEKNCIAYRGVEDLMDTLHSIGDDRYSSLLREGLKWVRQNTTVERARQVLDVLESRSI
jgi:hypothetical protein